MNQIQRTTSYILADIERYSRYVLRLPLREYQLAPAREIVKSVLANDGRTFAVMMSRQAGKNELMAQVEAYLLTLYSRKGGSIVKASPTFKPQTINSIRRLRKRLQNPWNSIYEDEAGYIIRYRAADILFFSAEPTASVVGATASIMLEADEAQDILQDKWNKDFRPMASSTNATTVMTGTAWSTSTLLAHTIDTLSELEASDQMRRVFRVPWDRVAAEVPAYGTYVENEIQRLGRDHPLIRTQYFLDPLDDQGAMFDRTKIALMHGTHDRLDEPLESDTYAMLIDVAAGIETNAALVESTSSLASQNPRRDATAITIARVIPGTPLPSYETVARYWWLGSRPTQQYRRICQLVTTWQPYRIVVDATGVGEGLASMLSDTYATRVIPLRLTSSTKSQLGWDFVSIIETGRYHDYDPDDTPETRQFWYETAACEYELSTGDRLKWGVWESPAYDTVARGHDDLLLSASFCAILDSVPWHPHVPSSAPAQPDVLTAIDRSAF